MSSSDGPPDLPVFVAFSEIEVAAAGGAVVEEAFRCRLGEVDTWPGFLHLEVWKDDRSVGRYVMVSWWKDEASFATYMRSAAHRRSHDRIPRGPHKPRAAGLSRFRVVAT